MGMKKAKLVDQYSEQARTEDKKGGIFTGVSIFVNGWTVPGSDELKRIMMTHGGIYHHYYNNHTTAYIIASNLPDVKLRQLKGHELIVKPEWITSCVEAGKLLDYKPFLLFTHQSKSQGTINFQPANKPSNQLSDQSIFQSNEDATNTSHHAVQSDSTDEKQGNGNENTASPVKVSDKDESVTKVSPFKAKDATDPRFLGEFYQNSRLHHISTMGANSKDYVNKLREKHNGPFPARDKLEHLRNTATDSQSNSVIMHIDMDCFFVSVGLRKRPDLVGKPVAVTHSRGNKLSMGAEEDRKVAQRRKDELQRYKEKLDAKAGLDPSTSGPSWKLENIDGTSSFSEIASCSYQARHKGVRNGMFLGPALKLCPDLATIPYDFPGYEEVSRILYDTVASYTLDIQAVSCDEMFVNLSPLLTSLRMDPLRFVSHLRNQISTETGCNCSVGLGPNIFLARMATKQAKPDGQYLLAGGQINRLLQELKVEQLPGVGRSLHRRLTSLGIQTCGELQERSLAQLQGELGTKTGSQLYNFSRGIDNRKLELHQVRKTVSAEVNYGIRFSGWPDAEQFLAQLAGEVSERLDKLGTRGRCLTLKLMVRAQNAPTETAKFLGHGVCDNISRSAQLSMPTAEQARIYKEVLSLLRQTDTDPPDIRGIGISVSKLEEKKGAASGNSSILKFVKPQKAAVQANKSISNLIKADITSPVLPDLTSANQAEDRGSLDPEVLAALPGHIRDEILANYKAKNSPIKHLNCEFNTEPDSTQDPYPSGSGSALMEQEYRIETADTMDYTVAGPLARRVDGGAVSLSDLSFSQLDNDVLDQLPPGINKVIYSKSFTMKNREKKRINPFQVSFFMFGFFGANPDIILEEARLIYQHTDIR